MSTWLVIPSGTGVGTPAALDDTILELAAEDMDPHGLHGDLLTPIEQRIRQTGAAKVARILWFSPEDTVVDPDGDIDEGLRDDADYLAWHTDRLQTARAEVADVMRMTAPGARPFDEPDAPRDRRRRWLAHWLLHRALPGQFPAPQTAVLSLTLQGLYPSLEFPRQSEHEALPALIGELLADGGHPFSALPPPRVWSDEIFCIEARSLGPGAPEQWGPQWHMRNFGGGTIGPRVEVRVYLPTRYATLPAAPWTSGAEWMSKGDLWKRVELD